MTTLDHARRITELTRLFAAYGIKPDDTRMAAYLDVLGNLEPEAVGKGVTQAMRESKDYPPGPGHVHQCALQHVRSSQPLLAIAPSLRTSSPTRPSPTNRLIVPWKPMEQAFAEVHDSDALTDAERKEAKDKGIPALFDRLYEARVDAYEASGARVIQAHWAALNDLCGDTTVGRFAKGVRRGRVRAVQANRRSVG